MSTADHAAAHLEIVPVTGIGEVRPGDDLAALVADRAELLDGDVVVVTSKIVSKAEGRLVPVPSADPAEREAARQRAIDSETVRVVARRGDLRIVQTRHGLVLAAAGVDASNVSLDALALLPVDPDSSARALREGLRARLGVEVGVIVSDTMGRAWRHGLTDAAIGVAGLTAVTDPRGQLDAYGNTLEVTEIAVADEIAAAADLVKGKLGGVPVAVVRGLAVDGKLPDDSRGSAPLLRDASGDLFRLGTAEAMALGRAQAAAEAAAQQAAAQQAGAETAAAPALHAAAVATLRQLPVTDQLEAAVREGFLGLLAARPDAMWRSCVPGHLTASALVLDPSRQAVLLTLHPRVGRWLQLGGHCEPADETLLAAAQREAREESGIDDLILDPTPLALDIHPITCSLGVPTRHFDVQYVALAPPGAEPVRSEESLDLRWFDWDDLPADATAELPDLVLAARTRLRV